MDKNRLLQLAGVEQVNKSSTIELLNEVTADDSGKSGLIVKLETDTESNNNFRKVIYTTELSQLVLMSLKPGEDIGSETHNGDQFIRIDKGQARSVLDGRDVDMTDGDAVVIPKGIEHNIINTSKTEDLKIYAVYSPPQHKDGIVDNTKPKKD